MDGRWCLPGLQLLNHDIDLRWCHWPYTSNSWASRSQHQGHVPIIFKMHLYIKGSTRFFPPNNTTRKKTHRHTDAFGHQAMAVDDWSSTTSQQIYQEHGQGHGHFSWNVTVVYAGILTWHIYWNNMYILPITTRLPYIFLKLSSYLFDSFWLCEILHTYHLSVYMVLVDSMPQTFSLWTDIYLKFVHRARRQMFESWVWAIIKVVFYQSSKGLGNNYESTDHR